MIPSSEQPAVLITATEYREGQTALRHDYFLRGTNAMWRVEEVSYAREHSPDMLCSFVVGPQGYSSIRMRHSKTGLITGITVGLPASGTQVGGARLYTIQGLSTTPPIILCDGPNPLFNYFNAMHLLAVTPGEERVSRVQVCDAGGGVREEQYSFLFDGKTISVRKGRDRGTDILELDDNYALRRVVSDNSEIVISRYSPMFLN